ncbi:TPA: hypothetical protein VDV48_000196 [Pseudomonas aeruginosa]|uniref:hypothetical protein n=1 Tax=Pseudomonas aeruginosa TaxID=287 RepID=UPI000BB692C1|nr:hypothetical protein [Pseudomonas aeruginosa]PBX41475.1 hypothetical protein CJT80_14815 [Pseudomonas aeruginosa]HCF6914560.1 hypothetical protein [Pseudomonas aeruginosa]HCU1918328.1 hypothetical protein [Pseudomonas aeruginosa]HEP9354050.1 hypothetical protein [Pseudomonas aeruginosa]HEP9380356.1 hypothetical protein [Pseudomonas aeruginosa]
MREDIKQAIECWASRPTWFSSHPSDAKELRQAVSKLKKLTPRPTKDELQAAIYLRVKDLPALMGTPGDIEKVAGEFAANMAAKL